MPNLIEVLFNKDDLPSGVFEVVDIILGKLYKLADSDEAYLPTNMKLQKLLYYAQGYNLGYFGSKMFDGEFQAWVNGPVVPSVYQQFKYYGTSVIAKSEIRGFANKELTNSRIMIIAAVAREYGRISPYNLSEMTHADGTAWKKTRRMYNLADSEPSQHVIPVRFIQEEFRGKELKGITINGRS